MCIACNWAPYFEAYGESGEDSGVSRRSVLRAGIAMTAALAAAVLPTTAAIAAGPQANELVRSNGDADFLFQNGKIFTQRADLPWADAVAIRGKRILFVGSEAGAKAFAGPRTKVIDLKGRLLMPGFVEGHTHPFLGAFLTSGLDLQVASQADALKKIEEYARQNPTGAIRGFGWRVDMFPPEGPTRSELDRIIPDRPAFFFAIDGHSLWVNSKALEVGGVTRDTPDPVPGFSMYVRDANGDPTGYVLEVNAVLGLVNAIEPISPRAMGKLMEGWLPKASAAGITTIFDAGVPPIGSDQGALIKLYTDVEKRNALPFRVAASYAVKSLPIDNTVAELMEVRRRVSSELVQVRTVKIVGDGSQGGYTAWLLEPYADKPDSIGASPFSEAQWHQLISAVDAAGFDVHVHACGERTTRVALDAIEQAMKVNKPRLRRHAIAHLVYVDDADMPRFGKLDVTAQFSANWSSGDPDTMQNMLERYGPKRQARMYRTKSVLRTGGRVSFGTDWPAAGYFSTYKPLDAIQVAATRQLIGDANAPMLLPADERLTVEEAIYANTLGAAYQLRMEDAIGSIEVGKFADLVVLDQNILECGLHEIHKTRVVLTMMNGVIRHQS